MLLMDMYIHEHVADGPSAFTPGVLIAVDDTKSLEIDTCPAITFEISKVGKNTFCLKLL